MQQGTIGAFRTSMPMLMVSCAGIGPFQRRANFRVSPKPRREPLELSLMERHTSDGFDTMASNHSGRV
jgi:hypothetical protein